MEENTIFIDNSDFPEDGITEDFHHMKEGGHKFIFKKVDLLLSRLIPRADNK
ncbi:hypothetical protein C900_03573 [Fulvivirga imtechensis AK7]|uniref:Uncharacterized protein n=1 Tax=Fulvivirga imtechensis AK7 TaxID=1237149 RepID=L8JTC3_9BACT|nr:hypothetical protein [Fulvivirga imtechensis]ELR70592.1 hypothetical protein C900_03573 [Fulvivirga imtechensis AK7]